MVTELHSSSFAQHQFQHPTPSISAIKSVPPFSSIQHHHFNSSQFAHSSPHPVSPTVNTGHFSTSHHTSMHQHLSLPHPKQSHLQRGSSVLIAMVHNLFQEFQFLSFCIC